jgi:hypothetical protein
MTNEKLQAKLEETQEKLAGSHYIIEQLGKAQRAQHKRIRLRYFKQFKAAVNGCIAQRGKVDWKFISKVLHESALVTMIPMPPEPKP